MRAGHISRPDAPPNIVYPLPSIQTRPCAPSPHRPRVFCSPGLLLYLSFLAWGFLATVCRLGMRLSYGFHATGWVMLALLLSVDVVLQLAV